MYSYLLLFSFPLAFACPNSPHVGVWEAQRGNTVLDASNALGLKDYHEITNLNNNVNPLNIVEGKKYTVPYVASVVAPAAWTTSSCTPVLFLSNTAAITTGTSDAATPKPTTLQTTLQRSPTTLVSPPATLSDTASSDIGENSDFAPSLSSKASSNPVKNLESPGVASTRTNTDLAPTSTGTNADLAPTSTETKADPAPTPLCFDNPQDLHTDRDLQKNLAWEFCDLWIGTMMTNTSNIRTGPRPENGVLYQFTISWIQGCDREEQMVDEQCPGTMISNYENCKHNNGGGGRTDRGCLRHEYSPNKLT